MDENKNVLKTGTTTVGIICKDGVVLGADKRATAGNFIASNKTDKIHKITDEIAVTIAGTASDAQMLVRLSQSELRLKKLRSHQKGNTKEAANLLSRMVYNNIRKMSMIPGISHFIIGGVDETGFHLYDCFPDGSLEEVKTFVSSGSGSVMVYGVLETMYKENMTLEEGVELVMKAINAALQRDSCSGDGLDIVTITKDGVKKHLERDLRVKIEI